MNIFLLQNQYQRLWRISDAMKKGIGRDIIIQLARNMLVPAQSGLKKNHKSSDDEQVL